VTLDQVGDEITNGPAFTRRRATPLVSPYPGDQSGRDRQGLPQLLGGEFVGQAGLYVGESS
jgi:hypothetical protein